MNVAVIHVWTEERVLEQKMDIHAIVQMDLLVIFVRQVSEKKGAIPKTLDLYTCSWKIVCNFAFKIYIREVVFVTSM